MKKEDVVRAWKDPSYRASLSAEQREALPECPAGSPLAELHEEQLHAIVGGMQMQLTPRYSCVRKYCPEELTF